MGHMNYGYRHDGDECIHPKSHECDSVTLTVIFCTYRVSQLDALDDVLNEGP
jgi:hypothetical protein